MAKIEMTTPSAGQNAAESWAPHPRPTATHKQPRWQMVWRSLHATCTDLPCDPATVQLGIKPIELKTYIHTKPASK